MVQVVESKHN